MAALLAGLPEHIPIETIDELWIFPPHRVGGAESTVVVVSAFEDGADRRRIFTARRTTGRDAAGKPTLLEELAEHGAAPADRVARLIEGVLRRLSDEFASKPPESVRLGGDAAQWSALSSRLTGEAASPPSS